MTPDQPITLAVAVLGIVLCLSLPRRYALVPLICSMFMYPSNLLVPPDGIGLTAQRLIGFVLLLRCVGSADIRGKFKFGYVDALAITYFMLLLVSQVITTQPPTKAIINRIGFFLSAMVPFWCTRFLITDRSSFYALLKGFLWGSVPIVTLGVIQMTSPHAYNPFFEIMPYGNPPLLTLPNQLFRSIYEPGDQRPLMGRMFFRANVAFMQCIMLGAFFSLQIAWCTNLFFEKKKIFPWILAWLLLPAGVICTISGGPMMAAALSFGVLWLFLFRSTARIWGSMILVGLLALILFANRDPISILANYGFSASSSWYRVGLQKYTLHEGGMNGHWLAGYGETPPNYQAQYRDLCIHWVLLLVNNGILGVIGFYTFLGACIRRMWTASKQAQSLEDQWLLWSLMASLVGSLVLMMIVSFWMEMYNIYHVFLAVLANTPMLVGGGLRYVGVWAEMNGKPVILRYTLKANQQLAILHPPVPAEPARPTLVSRPKARV